MLINDLVALLMQIPPMLAAQWGAWFVVGLILSIWSRRDKTRLVVHGNGPRPKSGIRPPSRPAKSVPHSSGDAFGELEALLEPQEGTYRAPGESPAPTINEPLRSAPVLAAPQSLP